MDLSPQDRSRDGGAADAGRFDGGSRDAGSIDAGACGSRADCDDGLACNGVELCADGSCVAGAPRCDDGDPCNGEETCGEPGGECTEGVPLACDNGLHCDGEEWCQTGVGCMPGTPVDCDDGIACTDDACDEDANACAGTPDPMRCPGGTCDPVEGGCLYPECTPGKTCRSDICFDYGCSDDVCVRGAPLMACDDGNECTRDTCDPTVSGGCVHTPITGPCDADGSLCTADSCDPMTGACVPGPVLSCLVGTVCNRRRCDPATGMCVDNLTAANGDPCALADPCRLGVCSGGTCTDNGAVICPDDGNPCTDDVCGATGICAHLAVNSRPCGLGTCDATGTCTCPAGTNDCNGDNSCECSGNCMGSTCPMGCFNDATPCPMGDECCLGSGGRPVCCPSDALAGCCLG